MRTLALFVVLAVLGLLAIGLWLAFRPFAEVFFHVGHDRHEWHQKLTVTVDTPHGERSASAVIRVVADFGRQLSGNEVAYGYQGEATVVEVAPGQYLFALLGGSEELFYAAARERFEGMTRGEWLYEIPKQTEPVTLEGELIPLLVTFRDVNDPKSVRRVDPTKLAARFGPGVRLKTVTLAVTDEPITEGKVEGVLVWLGRVRGRIKPTDKKFADQLTIEETLYGIDFKSGE